MCKFTHRCSISRFRFPIRMQNSAIWRRFTLITLFYILNVRHILPVCLTYWPRKYTTRVDPHVDNCHQVWSWYVHTLPSYIVFVCWYVTWPCDLDLWPLDLEQLLYMAGYVANLAVKFEYLTPIRSWVMSYNVSRWLPLKMRKRLLCMRRMTFHLLTLNSCHSWRVTWPHWCRQGGPGGPGHPQLPGRKEFLPRDAMHPRY